MADNTYETQTGAAASARPDLARWMSLFIRDVGAPDPFQPGTLAMRATVGFMVGRPSGMFSFPTIRTMLPEVQDGSGRRALQDREYPTLGRDARDTYNVDCEDLGWGDEIDEHDIEVVDERLSGMNVEQRKVLRAWNATQRTIDTKFLTPLGAATDPFDAAEVDVSGAPWTTVTNDAVDDFENAFAAYRAQHSIMPLNSIMLEADTWRYLKQNDALGGSLQDVDGGISNQDAATRLANLLGVVNIFVGLDGSALGDDVICFHISPSFVSFPRAWFAPAMFQGDARGVRVFDRRNLGDEGTISRFVAAHRCDFPLPTEGGVRLKDVLNNA